MFFDEDRIPAIREMICSDTVEQREKALAKLEPMQQSDFEGIYEAMEGCPVTIRFLDPPCMSSCPPRRRTSRRSPGRWASPWRSSTT